MFETAMIVGIIVGIYLGLKAYTGNGEDAAMYMVMGVVGLLIIGCIFAGVQYVKSPDLVTLKKGEWTCVHTHSEMVLVGKILMPQDVCDTYQSVGAK